MDASLVKSRKMNLLKSDGGYKTKRPGKGKVPIFPGRFNRYNWNLSAPIIPD